MANYDSLPKDMWEAARVIWESTEKISDRDLLARLQEIYGDDAPKSHTAIYKRRTKENWHKVDFREMNKGTDGGTNKGTNKKAGNKNPNNRPKPLENNKETTEGTGNKNSHDIVVWQETEEKIHKAAEKLVLDNEQKARIIKKHRKRIEQLGQLQESTMGVLDMLHGKDLEEDSEEISKIIIIAETSSRTLAQLSTTQKVVFEQEMAVCGITVDDFKESEQDRRMKGIEQLAGIADEEAQARQQLQATLKERLERFRTLEIDELSAQIDADFEEDFEDIEEE